MYCKIPIYYIQWIQRIYKQKSLTWIFFFIRWTAVLLAYISWIWNLISTYQRVGFYVNKHNINVWFLVFYVRKIKKEKRRPPFSDVCTSAPVLLFLWFAYVPVSNILLPQSRVMCSFAIIIFRPSCSYTYYTRSVYSVHIMSHSRCPFCL